MAVKLKPKVNSGEKYCGKCETVKPLAAFRLDSRRSDGRDGQCKACRREYAVNNRDKANARWKTWAHAQPKTDPTPEDRKKTNARQSARRHVGEHRKCKAPKCTNRGQEHHYAGYDGANAKKTLPLCPYHHAEEHILDRARTADGPTYM